LAAKRCCGNLALFLQNGFRFGYPQIIGSKISSRVIAATLSILLVSSFVILAFCYVRPFYQLSAAQLRDAGLELKKLTPPGASIVAADMGDPTFFIMPSAKVVTFWRTTRFTTTIRMIASQQSRISDSLRRRGATHFVFTRNTFWWLHSYPEFAAHLWTDAMPIEATPEFKIYKLTPRHAIVIPSEVEESGRLTAR
jgi:hypothetical protein